MHVVKQLDLFAQFLPADFQQFQRAAEVDRRFEDRLIVQRLHRRPAAAGAVAGHPGTPTWTRTLRNPCAR